MVEIYTAMPASSTALKKEVSSALQQRWAQLIKEVYEADPLICPEREGSMRIIACIDQPEVIEKIFTYLGLCPVLQFRGYFTSATYNPFLQINPDSLDLPGGAQQAFSNQPSASELKSLR